MCSLQITLNSYYWSDSSKIVSEAFTSLNIFSSALHFVLKWAACITGYMSMHFFLNYTNCFDLSLYSPTPTSMLHHSWDILIPRICSGLRQLISLHTLHLSFLFFTSNHWYFPFCQSLGCLFGWGCRCPHILNNYLLQLKEKCILAQLLCSFSQLAWVHTYLFLCLSITFFQSILRC